MTKKETYVSYNGQFVMTGSVAYTYDTKKNPFYGLGFDMIPELSSENNVTKSVDTDYSGATSTTVYTMEYNSNSYPTKSTSTEEDGSTEVTENVYVCK